MAAPVLKAADKTTLLDTKAKLEAKTTSATPPAVRTFTETIYEDYTMIGENPPNKSRKIKYRAGQQVTQTEIDALGLP